MPVIVGAIYTISERCNLPYFGNNYYRAYRQTVQNWARYSHNSNHNKKKSGDCSERIQLTDCPTEWLNNGKTNLKNWVLGTILASHPRLNQTIRFLNSPEIGYK